MVVKLISPSDFSRNLYLRKGHLMSKAEIPLEPTDEQLEQMIVDVRDKVANWIKRQRLGRDWCIKTYEEHYSNDKPGDNPVILVLCYEGERLQSAIEERLDGAVFRNSPFWGECYDNVTMHILHADKTGTLSNV
jgi:hypothetical protein